MTASAPTREVATSPVTASSSRSARQPGATHATQRSDIQGLRAVAVLLVVAYHLRPDRLTGGFIGVDVFFVISGFLIVGTLAREAESTGSVRLRAFYARRIRRLIPAATVVLVATMAATVLVLPVSRWRAVSQDVLAAALQVQNWALALGSGSYDDATAAVSPLQHYWSLAVEEQFYLVTPFLLLAALWVARRRGATRMPAMIGALAVVTVLSFAHSVLFSRGGSDVAYFATTTRVWELGLGGLLAMLLLSGRLGAAPARGLLGWIGLAAIGASALSLTGSADFPGWVAAVPVLGTCLVLWSGAAGDPAQEHAPSDPWWSAAGFLSRRPLTYVGDISYSLYLWHWPAVVFFLYLVERQPTKRDLLVLLPLMLVVAAVSKAQVEDRFRRARPAPAGRGRHGALAFPESRAFALGATLLVVSLVVSAGPWAYVKVREAGLSAVGLDADHPGGAAPLPEELPPAEPGIAVLPDPLVAMDDRSLTMTDPCDKYVPGTAAGACAFGDVSAAQSVVLVGDSHASHFSTALADVSEQTGWRLEARVRAGCPFNAVPAVSPNHTYTECVDANRAIVDEILQLRPEVVVSSAMVPEGYDDVLEFRWPSRDALIEGYRELWRPILEAGIRVVVVRDVPFPRYTGPECVEENGPASAECALTRAEAEEYADPQVEAAEGMSGVSVVDLTDHFCNSDTCPAVVGNVLVYRDNHVTDTFARSLAPALGRGIGLL
ncbi:acyltransferase family protein [Geodermatophilus poikilotrophus]|uniref:Peptidoglycan/LPS O-acetylase OafA/YrhL, contains acyltransferase and SGNH-hydrolase domains n=1 Tax=Geodermatophilus poikilotrophus TaxID=1333667 RepID=A0A1I0H4Q0_9ACTN|nr:acyltransferase family protein [Geodermatophilus poikilotrophus]SET77798.1 Peptidoglycan/LPS O-acetylase OafA/YrhL, contains acyltransferase and SGNH-hydrolase domains [Geodermatophilus poikilotrophus]